MSARIGDTKWMMELTGWSRDRICRLARQPLIPGAFQIRPGYQGSRWEFNKARVLQWWTALQNQNEGF
ncbi:MAG TPA: hypothetical protein VE860_07685 [Chthoniobacterales bacterium]|jgi:hypothetical protein|nr:hypothetical protein [Chthoniobacterales bacterium]